MSLDLYPFIEKLQSFPPLVISLLMFLAAYVLLTLFASLFGESGLYCFIVIAIIMANIQVLKVTQFALFDRPVALGTELFASTYLATDILSEVYGEKSARKGVALGFLAMIAWTIFALITLGYRPISPEAVNNNSFLLSIQGSLESLFLPAPRFLIASLIAYAISQSHDVFMFNTLKRATKGKHLWIRNNGSTLLSALIDNVVFSIFAFMILAPSDQKKPLFVILFTYILGTYLFRVVAALLDTPFIYIAKSVLMGKQKKREAQLKENSTQ